MPNQDMLINYVSGEECRIALVEDGKLEELYTERASDDIHVGNIYRGRVTNVEPSIQAAFIDFGLDRNGFLHISDLHPRYFPGNDNQTEKVGRRTPRRDRPPIQQCLKRGQRILVQVLKEGIGTKGPTLTSYLSIPGRFLVMMPDMERHGVSRKIDDEDKRREMRKILDDLDPPNEFGFIVRTAGIGRTKAELKRDLAYLLRLWKTIDKRKEGGRGPAELYRESDLVIRTLRDVLTNDVQRIIVDDVNAAQRAKDFLRIAMPRASVKVIHYDRPVPLLDAFDIERQIETINSRTVPLPSGGSLVVDTTEALVAIDVNSGKSRDNKDAETTAYETNKEAVDEIARQLRLRDLGGVVVLDLIDMYQNKHRRDIERRFRDCLKKDRARSKITRINEIGLLSMTRQRMRPSLKKSLHQSCSRCSGTGTVKTAESVALDVMRRLAVVLSCDDVARVELRVSASVGAMLLNRKRHALHMLEEHLGKPIEFKFDADLESDTLELVALDGRGVQMDLEKLPRPKKPKFTDSDEVQAGAGMDVDESDVDDTEDTDDEQADEARGRKQGDSGKQEKQSQQDQQAQQDGDDESGGKRKRRRRRRGGRGRRKRSGNGDQQNGDQQKDEQSKDDSDDQNQSKSDRQSQGSDSSEKTDTKQSDDSNKDEQAGDDGNDDQDEKPKRRRRRRGGRGRRKKDDQNQPDEQAQQDQADDSKDSGKADDGRKQPSDQNGKQAAAKDEQAKQDKPQKSDDQSKSESADDSGSKDDEKQESKPKPRRRRRKTTKSAKADSSDDKSDDKSESAEASTEKQEEQVS